MSIDHFDGKSFISWIAPATCSFIMAKRTQCAERDEWQEVSRLPSPKSALAAVVVPREELTREAQERCRYQKRGDFMEEEIEKSLARLEINLN